MLRRILLGSTVLSVSLLSSQMALADVTADDVRAAYAAAVESWGGQVFETITKDGADTVVTDEALLFRFPFDVGTVRVELPDYRMIPQSDGTIVYSYPDELKYRIEVDIPSEGAGAIVIDATASDLEIVASGTAEEVTIAQSSSDFTIKMDAVDGAEEFFDISFVGQTAGFSIRTTIETGDMVTVTSSSSTAPAELAFAITDVEGAIVSETSQLGANETTIETSLPAGGSNLLNLSPAFAAGAYIRGTVEDEGGTSESVTTIDGDVVAEEFQKTSASTSRFSIDKDGLDVFGETGPAEFRVNMQEFMPFPIEGSVAGGTGGIVLPLMPSADPQDVSIRFDLRDLSLSDAVWDLFDTAGDLPRGPVSFNMDVAGSVISGIDFLNFETLEDQMGQGIPPISLESLTINEVSVEALDASALASGAFIVDNSDTTTFDGFPRPEGSAILNVSGANALLDRLVALGVLGSDEASMARLGMGFIAKSTGADSFETRLDVNNEGHVIVNGQRMR